MLGNTVLMCMTPGGGGRVPCIGALDETHIPVICLSHEDCLYYNWRGFYFVMLQAIVDHHRAVTHSINCKAASFKCSSLSKTEMQSEIKMLTNSFQYS
ncbi:hypothetical protein Y1Q_0022952 [Alligator mississippiensis]|uniref:Uncharacterized protein n=1 Tax=Alligator mississippiensis TaxID=8496 RepID=A0A151P7H3_ALLMI|nr:hypothetical protein Y1Q_0022952 [Alligator mississippiensis]